MHLHSHGYFSIITHIKVMKKLLVINRKIRKKGNKIYTDKDMLLIMTLVFVH